VHVAARVQKRPTIAQQPLHNEAFAAEQARTNLLVKRNAHTHALGCTEKGVLLSNQLVADFRKVHRRDLAQIRRAERDPLLALTAILKDGHKQ